MFLVNCFFNSIWFFKARAYSFLHLADLRGFFLPRLVGRLLASLVAAFVSEALIGCFGTSTSSNRFMLFNELQVPPILCERQKIKSEEISLFHMRPSRVVGSCLF